MFLFLIWHVSIFLKNTIKSELLENKVINRHFIYSLQIYLLTINHSKITLQKYNKYHNNKYIWGIVKRLWLSLLHMLEVRRPMKLFLGRKPSFCSGINKLVRLSRIWILQHCQIATKASKCLSSVKLTPLWTSGQQIPSGCSLAMSL